MSIEKKSSISLAGKTGNKIISRLTGFRLFTLRKLTNYKNLLVDAVWNTFWVKY